MIDEYKYYLPVLGVIIGWFLNELSLKFRKNRDDKRQIRSIISQLFELKFRLEQMIPIFEDARENGTDIHILELVLSPILESEQKELKSIIEDLRISVKIISSFDPFIALDLKVILNEDIYFNSKIYGVEPFEFKEIARVQIGICTVYSQYITKQIRKLLRKTDIICYLKFLFRTYKDKKNIINPFEGLFKN
jgi:hypothetical protein